ncbi:hypothetical protein HMPREF0156_00013 [Bacteroidetes oral taxon 274 str. F0058]|nr:hypothetical protein HMPREF0156_00013 [Bacteroidetes oral taxon 274 str. F0058]
MENILLILSLLALVKSLFMTALLPNRWYRLGFCLLLGVFVFVSHGYAIELNKLQVQQLLSTQDSLLNISFVVMIDSILSVYFCVARLGGSDSSKVKRYMSVLRYMPSLLVFPAVFYIHVNLFFSIVATDFMLITSGWALLVVLLFVVASLFMRRLFAEKELPIEIILILTLLLFMLTVCGTVFHPSATVYGSGTPVDWIECVTTLGLLIIIMLAGYIFSNIRKIIKRKKNNIFV